MYPRHHLCNPRHHLCNHHTLLRLHHSCHQSRTLTRTYRYTPSVTPPEASTTVSESLCHPRHHSCHITSVLSFDYPLHHLCQQQLFRSSFFISQVTYDIVSVTTSHPRHCQCNQTSAWSSHDITLVTPLHYPCQQNVPITLPLSPGATHDITLVTHHIVSVTHELPTTQSL